jgi:hypothetical protein
MAWYITSTDLWGDGDGCIESCDAPVSFFVVSPAETNNVTIDGLRLSGVRAGKVVYIAGMGADYLPEVRMTSDSAIATTSKVVGVTVSDQHIEKPVAVNTTGVVKVTAATTSSKPSIAVGKFLIPTYGGNVISAPAINTNSTSWIDARFALSYQSAGSGDEFLAKVLR